MTVQNVNNKQATTTLNEPSNITSGQTAIDVDDNYATAGFPEAPFAVLIDSELVLVTSTGTGTDWTIERGYGGTTAATHNDGVTLAYKLTAEWFNAVVDGHIITSSGTPVTQRPKLNFDSNFTVTDGALSDDYWTVLDSHSPLFSLTLQDNKNDRLSLVTFTENGAPTYNDDTAPTVDSSSSAYFDGTGDQLTLAGASAYNTDITVIMWYKGTDVGGDDNLNNLGVNLFACNTGSTVKRWILGIDSNGYFKTAAGNSMAAGAVSTSVINDDAWHMLATTVSSASGVTLVGYLDGSSIGSGTDSAGAGNPQLQIMGPGRSTGGLGIGNVAEVSIIPSVLTSGDISALWAARNVSSTETLTTISSNVAVPQWISELAERTDSYGAHALDDEFQDASIAGGYTLVQPSGTQTAIEALDVLAVQPLTANSTDDIAAYVKSIASVTAPCTLETAVRFTNISSGNDYLMFGPLFSNGTTATTSNVMLAMCWTSAAAVKFDGRYGVFNTMGTNEGFDVIIENTAWLMYLRVIWKTTNTFRIGFSTNGITWKYSGDLSHTMTPTHIGVGWSTWGMDPESEEMLAFEYLRVTEADLSA